MQASDISNALGIAAEENIRRGSSWDSGRDDRSHSKATRQLHRNVLRFLENVPDEMTVMELREELDALTTQGGGDGR